MILQALMRTEKACYRNSLVLSMYPLQHCSPAVYNWG